MSTKESKEIVDAINRAFSSGSEAMVDQYGCVVIPGDGLDIILGKDIDGTLGGHFSYHSDRFYREPKRFSIDKEKQND